MFDKVLIANRGEIACRVIRTLREMEIASVAVYSDADRDAKHVRDADESVHLGPTNARESYLNIAKVIDAAKQTGAQAIHPGYGFLAENASFAQACADNDIVFIGPSAAAIETMGDKISAKATVSKAGVPVVPGKSEPGLTNDDLVAAAHEVGFPVLIKPSAGGGGKGMYLVEAEKDLRSSVESARREAASSFGDDTLFLERFVKDPRHIEVQVLADNHGNTIHLGERECSLQRRHQKIIEEAPSALLDEATRERIGKAAVDTAASVGYSGAGTVEFIVSADQPDEFFFMEMNTRLQVEHPVTEMVTGVDLVEQQILVAAGETLQLAQSDITLTGHAIEARVYAENPDRDFLPTGGKVLRLVESATPFTPLWYVDESKSWHLYADDRIPTRLEGIRVDSALIRGLEVATTYDPMIAKVIAHADTREEALDLLDDGLANYTLVGVVSNLNFLRALLQHPAVRSGDLDTGLVGREIDSLVRQPIPATAYAGVVLSSLVGELGRRAMDDSPWASSFGWRAGRDRAPWAIAIRTPYGDIERVLARVDDRDPMRDGIGFTLADGTVVDHQDHPITTFTVNGESASLEAFRHDDQLWVHADGYNYLFTDVEPEAQLGGAAVSGEVRSPMPGTVIAVHTEPGAEVDEGEPLIVVEAMKMEHVLKAPVAGVVSDFTAATGTAVVVDELLMTVEPTD